MNKKLHPRCYTFFYSSPKEFEAQKVLEDTYIKLLQTNNLTTAQAKKLELIMMKMTKDTSPNNNSDENVFEVIEV